MGSAKPSASPKTRRVDIVLEHLYDYRDNRAHPMDADRPFCERDNCIIVLSILLTVGNVEAGKHIRAYESCGVSDRHLPMSLASLSASGLPFAEEFDKAQWSFSPVKFHLHTSKHHTKPGIVVPICKFDPICPGRGGTAQLWQIAVQEEFVNLELRERVKTCRFEDEKFGWCYQFALKQYGAIYKRLFDNEVRAFGALKDNDGMIQYLGDYEYKDTETLPGGRVKSIITHNLILEYAELDLTAYFQENQPPILDGELVHFWEDMIDVAQAVKAIHKVTVLRNGEQQQYHGWHADIKPDNILIVQKKFKLADPGFAHFERKSDKDLTTITGGTETYGAPECYRAARKSDGKISQFQRTIDIWSLGCVFSIAATWVVLGYDGIPQFTTFRTNAVETIMKKQASTQTLANKVRLATGDYFHDGHDVLGDVQRWHDFLRKHLRRGDMITSKILDLVDKRMLLGEPGSRMQAGDLCVHLKELLNTEKSRGTERLSPSIMRALLTVDDAAPERPQHSKSSSNLISVDRKKDRLGHLEPPKKTTHRSEYLRSALYPGGLVPETQSTGTSFVTQKSSVLDSSRNVHGSHDRLQQREQQAVPEDNELEDKIQHLRRDSRAPTSLTHLSLIERHVTADNLGFKPQNVWQARYAMSNKSKFPWSNARKDEFLTSYFDHRDIVFLVDDAASMEDEWPEATYLLETLAMKLEGQDKNGMDLFFTNKRASIKNCKNPSKFKDKMNDRAVRPVQGARTDIVEPLRKIFNDYLHELRSTLSGRRIPLHKAKKLTLIILTDGKWERTEDEELVVKLISAFIDDMKKITTREGSTGMDKLEKRRVSIEFVQLGNDEAATAKLRRLDDDLPFRGVEDIVDTEPSHGDVNKMILGSFVEAYDRLDGSISTPNTYHGEEPSQLSPYRPTSMVLASGRQTQPPESIAQAHHNGSERA